jgi:zinc protease
MEPGGDQLAEDGISLAAIDGVRVCWVDDLGPPRALLQFRVGVADEPFVARGVSHLVEHLTLAPFAGTHQLCNGYVDLGRTAFVTQGDPDHVVDFLDQVCRRLHDLPVERLDRERRILRTEGQQRQSGVMEELLVTRFGARTYGLAAHREWGLDHLDGDDISQWAAARFVAGNAVCWLSFPPPDGLRFDLPPGPWRPLPVPTVVDRELPVAHRWGSVGGFSWLSSRSPLAAMAEMALVRHLEARLRHEAGATYSVVSHVDDVGPGQSMHAVLVDVADRAHQVVADSIHEVVHELARDGHTASDADAWRHTARQAALSPGASVGVLDAVARRMLFGEPLISGSRWIHEAGRVTPEEVAGEIERGIGSGIFVIPHGANPPEPLPLLRRRPGERIEGRSWRSTQGGTPAPAPATLTVGEQGVSIEAGAEVSTARWDGTVAVLRWSDGGRVLVGEDGDELAVLPDRWDGGGTAVEEIDRWVDDLPAVDVGRRLSPPSRSAVDRPRLVPWFAWVLAILGALWLVQGVMGVVTGSGDDQAGEFASVAIVGLLALAVAALLVWRRRRAHRGLATWDSAQAHWSGLYPDDAPSTGGYQLTGLVLAWLVRRDLVSGWFVEESADLIDRLHDRSITPVELATEWEGTLSTDMVTPRGNAFLHHYLAPPSRSRVAPVSEDLDALCRRFGVASMYHLPDSWEVFEAISTQIDARYRLWGRVLGRLHPA